MFGNKIFILCLLVIIVLLINVIFFNKEKFSNKNVFDNFDKVLYINLKHREDRKKQIESELLRIGIPKNKIHRIDAVHEKLNGHIGCAKSHVKALEYCKRNKLKKVIIFEDDFVFTKDKNEVQNKINKFLVNRGNDWDACQLTTVYKKYDDTNLDFIKKVKRASTSSSYMINEKFYNKLLDDLNTAIKKMTDEMIEYNKKNPGKKKLTSNNALDQHWSSLQNKSKWYVFYPYLGKQGGKAGRSSIMSRNLEGFNSVIGLRLYALHV